MKRKVIIFILLLAFGIAIGITACAGSSRGVRVESANEVSITLSHLYFSDDANNLRIADEHCKKFGKVAQFAGREKDRVRYNCVRQ